MNAPRRIHVHGGDMPEAFKAGLEHYQPVYPGMKLEVEAGITDHSLENVRALAEKLGGVRQIDVGKNGGVLVWFADDGFGCYLATGFGIGYGGTGPTGFARFVSEQGLASDISEAKQIIAGRSADWTGTLFRRKT